MTFSFFKSPSKGKKMSEANQNTEHNPADENAEAQATCTPEERIAELEGMLQDEKLRGLANEQNLRRRHQEELQAAHKFAAQKFAAEMLSVKDYLEMALLDQSGNFDALKMGVSMTLNELNKAFDAAQVKVIESPQGGTLNPHQHQAMQEVDAPDQAAGSIVSTLKKGYTLHDRVLRPAMVTVAKANDTAE